jgi:hypothetical protein
VFDRSDHRRQRWPYVWVALVTITHRVVLFSIHRADLRALAEANPLSLTVQLLPLELLRTNATAALLYLQQTPPVPNLIMVLAAKWLAWPVETANALILLQTAISAMTALLLVRIILLLFPKRPAAWGGVSQEARSTVDQMDPRIASGGIGLYAATCWKQLVTAPGSRPTVDGLPGALT